jgi:hypothetical protein
LLRQHITNSNRPGEQLAALAQALSIDPVRLLRED